MVVTRIMKVVVILRGVVRVVVLKKVVDEGSSTSYSYYWVHDSDYIYVDMLTTNYCSSCPLSDGNSATSAIIKFLFISMYLLS